MSNNKYARQLIFSNSNEFTPSYIKLVLKNMRLRFQEQTLENFKYLPLQSIEEITNILDNDRERIWAWEHPFVSKEQPNESYIPYSECKICGKICSRHSSFIHNRKSHSLQKKRSFINDNKTFICEKQFTNKKRAKSPLLKRKGIINYTINSFECAICLEDIPEDDKEKVSCHHQFCKECMIDYLVQCISVSNVPIKCPDINCKCEFDNDFVYERVSSNQYVKYKKFLQRNKIAHLKNAIVCPIVNCESYAILPNEVENEDSIGKDNFDTIMIYKGFTKTPTDNKDNQQTGRNNSLLKSTNKNDKPPVTCRCIENNHEFCSRCKQFPHPGIPCSSTEEEKWNKYKKDNNVKNCPLCRIEISKNMGCNHIHCACGYDFCWLCGGAYTNDHYSIPFTPCYKKQFTEDPRDINNEVLEEAENRSNNKCKKFFKILFGILVLLLLTTFIFALAGFVYAGFTQFLYCKKRVLERMGQDRLLIYILFFATTAFLGIAMIPFGYLLVAGIILFVPLEICFRINFIEVLFLDEYVDEILRPN